MDNIYSERQRILSENTVNDNTSDFTTKYFAVCHLQTMSHTTPEMIVPSTISALEKLLKSPGFTGQRRGFFLFRQAAETLRLIIIHSEKKAIAGMAFSALRNTLGATNNHAHRTTAEALGSLPFSLPGPEVETIRINRLPRVSWQKLLDEKGIKISSPPSFVGRSFVAPLDQKDRVAVFKLARAGDAPEELAKETFWMEYLRSGGYSFPEPFHIPAPIKVNDAYVFRLQGITGKPAGSMELHPKRYAIGFIASKHYFTYPNHSANPEQCADDMAFKEIMFRNARILGELTALGIVHSAPIPLFHNRVQRERRRDRGLYEWFRAGRLDRWLASCDYPNLAPTGIRDFEHLTTFRGEADRNLYRHVGTHFLSLLLVSGSYFRNKNKERVGLDPDGKPVDARDLFDEHLMKEIIQGIFFSYYRGFTGTDFTGEFPLDPDKLTARMIEEMGVDRYMEEILRWPDQNEMTDAEFRHFLQERGYSREEIRGFRKGGRDIVIYTGPHLGGFNERISLPELIESVETMSALCIAGRYWREA
ncbi:SidJ-related pseudokinase [Desulfococcaceae bacterium HSG8]|nr:SidJ-related pseudokinase [Desulfococcaceae bacterium HSG8]